MLEIECMMALPKMLQTWISILNIRVFATVGTTDQSASTNVWFKGVVSTKPDPKESRAARHASLTYLDAIGPLLAWILARLTIKSWVCAGASLKDWTRASVLSCTVALCCMSDRWDSNDAAKVVSIHSRP